MRSVAGEGADAGKSLIDAFEHLVEGVGKVGDFVFFPGDGQTGFEIAFVDAARLGCQSCHGAKRLAAHEVAAHGGEQNHDGRKQQEIGAEVDQQRHGLV